MSQQCDAPSLDSAAPSLVLVLFALAIFAIGRCGGDLLQTSVITDVVGMSGRAMIEALVAGDNGRLCEAAAGLGQAMSSILSL